MYDIPSQVAFYSMQNNYRNGRISREMQFRSKKQKPRIQNSSKKLSNGTPLDSQPTPPGVEAGITTTLKF